MNTIEEVEDRHVLTELTKVIYPIVGQKGKKALRTLTRLGYDIANPKEWDLLIDELLDHDVEVCPNCGTWCISYMLTNMNGEVDKKCDHCR